MKKIIEIEESIAAIIMITISLLTLFQVIFRYILNIPFPWLEEITRYLTIFMVYLASAAAVYRREHLNVELMDLVLNKNKLLYLGVFHQIIIGIFLGVFIYQTFKFTMNQINVGQVTPALQISFGWPMSALLIGGLLMIISVLGSIIQLMQIRREE